LARSKLTSELLRLGLERPDPGVAHHVGEASFEIARATQVTVAPVVESPEVGAPGNMDFGVGFEKFPKKTNAAAIHSGEKERS